MSTQQTAHKNNGDTASHAEKATEAVARKYYTQVEGKTLEEARKIIANLVAKGMLRDSGYYNQAITRDAKEKENVLKREQARKEREEAEAKARDEFNEGKAKKEQDKSSGYFELGSLELEQILSFIEKGATKATIAGLLKALHGFSKAQIETFMSVYMPEKVKSQGHRGERHEFMSKFLDGKMSNEDFDVYMQAQSPNVQKRRPFYRAMFDTFNAIHDKYSN
jgi:hypothetical protein